MITHFDSPERDMLTLARNRALRPSAARQVLAELAGELPLDELQAAVGIFQHELDARRGKAKYRMPSSALV